MNLTNRTVLIIALVLAAVTGFVAFYYLSQTAAAEDAVPVLVAEVDVSANTVMSQEMVKVQQIPAKYAHPHALRSPQAVNGKIAKAQLLKGEQILNSKITDRKQPGDRFSYKIPDKMRAMTLAVDEVSGVAGFPIVGDIVDILLTKGKDEGAVTTTVFQNKEILATGSVSVPQEDGEQRIVPTVTLCVTPDEAQQISTYESAGKIRFTLRSPADKEVAALAPASAQ